MSDASLGSTDTITYGRFQRPRTPFPAVLFDQVLEDLVLPSVDQASERRDQNVERVDLGHGSHCHCLANPASATSCGSAEYLHPAGSGHIEAYDAAA